MISKPQPKRDCIKTETVGKGIRQKLLKEAARDLRWIDARGYPRRSAIRFIGDHYQLSARERDILLRSAFPAATVKERRRRVVQACDLSKERVIIDGYNVTITIESALSGRLIILADDGFVRDVSRIFRSFMATEQTRVAWSHILRFLKEREPGMIEVVLDRPMSKSAELAARITRWMKECRIPGLCTLSSTGEKELAGQKGIKASADTVIIDHSDRVFDLAGHIIRRRLRIRPFRY